MDYTTLKEVDDLYQNTSHRGNELLPEQAEAFNILLTAISQNVTTLKNNIKRDNLPNTLGAKEDSASIISVLRQYQNWVLLIDHLLIEIIPEVYALFHDDRQLTNSRRYLHQYMLSVWQQSQSWLGNIVVDHTHTSSNFSGYRQRYDNYIMSLGDNAKTARLLFQMTLKLDVNIDLYINQLDTILACYTDTSKLKTILSLQPSELIEHIEHWQSQRLIAFSHSHNQASEVIAGLLTNDSTLLIGNNHPLARYASTDMTPDTIEIQRLRTNSILSKKERKQLINGLRYNYKIPLTFLAFIAFLNMSFFGVILITLASLASGHFVFQYLQTELQLKKWIEPYLLQGFQSTVYNLTLIAAVLFISSFFLDGFMTSFLLFLVMGLITLGVQYCFDQTAGSLLLKVVNKQPLSLEPNRSSLNTSESDPDTLNDVQSIDIIKQPKIKKTTLKKSSIKQSHVESTSTIKDSKVTLSDHMHTELLPVDVNVHTYHLKIILSDPAEDILETLVNTVNQSHKSIDYLQEEHAYLATSVKELLLDIVNNSLLRLDNIAKTFVSDGEVNLNAKQVFAEQYEKQVTELFHHHIEELTALNQSIIEKQMAGFSQTGTEEELKFRDSVMELKILLRWHIAQSPNNETASSHHVILKSLEDTTLKQMTDAFYATTSTAVQRQKLQSQIGALLEHFKLRSTMNDTSSDDVLLQLTHNKGVSIDDLDLSRLDDKQKAYRDNISEFDSLDASNSKAETQEFIDFNEHYINQIKKHW